MTMGSRTPVMYSVLGSRSMSKISSDPFLGPSSSFVRDMYSSKRTDMAKSILICYVFKNNVILSSYNIEGMGSFCGSDLTTCF